MKTDPLLPLAQCVALRECTKLGKQAIQGTHRNLLPDITHSCDFEEAANRLEVDESLRRWDYLVRGERSREWVAFEVHQANVRELTEKKADSQKILKAHCPSMLAAIKAWHVCVKGDMPPSVRTRLVDQGIRPSRNLINLI